MAKHLEVPVTLLTPGTINENLHYGPFARYWWSSRSTNGSNKHIFFPIRLAWIFCSSGSFSGKIETSPTRAISSLYNEIFHNSTKLSGPTIIGQDDPKIIEEISRGVRFIPFQITIDKYKIFIHDLGVSSHPEWHNAGSGYSSSLLHFYNKKQALFVSRIVDNECIIEIYQQAQKIKIIRGSTPSEVWRKSWFMEKELRAWRALLKAAGAHLITPFNSDESKFQFWTRASNPIKDSDTISNLYKMGFLVSTPIHMPNSTKKFWYCFDRAIKENKKTHDGKRRVIFIIADQFTYSQLEKNLKVSVI
ncbi:unnamed protein product [Rhizophagus irregularis]|nr:unnamed protein product [Rhizophagus irregularis]